MSARNVVFDVGQVLVRWNLRALFEKLIDDAAELDWFLANVVTSEWHHQHDEGRPIAEMVAERSAQFPGHAHLIAAYAARFNETIPGPVPGMMQIVERLDRAGVPLYAITNFGVDFWKGFRPTAPVLDRFRDIVVSGEERLAKPDAEIFVRAARRFAIEPAESLFIDDKAENIAAARALGWQVHHFHDAPRLCSDLFARGLLGE